MRKKQKATAISVPEPSTEIMEANQQLQQLRDHMASDPVERIKRSGPQSIIERANLVAANAAIPPTLEQPDLRISCCVLMALQHLTLADVSDVITTQHHTRPLMPGRHTVLRTTHPLLTSRIRALIQMGHLTATEALHMPTTALAFFSEEATCMLFLRGILTKEDVFSLPEITVEALQSFAIRDLFIRGDLTKAQLFSITPATISLLSTNRRLPLTLAEILQAREETRMALADSAIWTLWDKNKLTQEELLEITEPVVQALKNADVRLLFEKGVLRKAVFLSMSADAVYALQNTQIRQLFLDGWIDQTLLLSHPWKEAPGTVVADAEAQKALAASTKRPKKNTHTTEEAYHAPRP
ncbi:MAG: hypothetical protein A3J38_03445 [Gammaproteobacteria bacterium RIFCSPHIGHO2_12_FULL_45_9]|nr:MAG: hypothetical protein A3J38_03445 [Gammaproteobacteria bacterium RIFCSPHIGHO2_12_FULL_45_9]